jgi:glycosyltransferase involved in cell wall biosynthesis
VWSGWDSDAVRVLLISGFFAPQHSAGSEKRALGYARTLLDMGHSVQVLCAGSFAEGARYWNGYSDEVYQDVPVRRVQLNWSKSPDPNRDLCQNPVVAERLDPWLAEWQPDVAHVISCYTLSASVIEVLKRRAVPIVVTLVDFWFVCPRLSLLHADGSLCDGRTAPWECLRCLLWDAKAYRWPRRLLPEQVMKRALTGVSRHRLLNRWRGLRGMALDMQHRKSYLPATLRQADAVTAPSRALAEMVRRAGLDVPIQVIHSGHDLSWVRGMPARQPSPVVRFGYIGHIHPAKGVHELVAAFGGGDFAGRATLSIYGDPGHSAEYMRCISGLLAGAATGMELRGPFPPDRLGDVLAEIDVVVVPSMWCENNPRVVQEAFASKAPVIASNVAGIAEFVKHGVDGLLFARGEVAELRRQMTRMVDEPSLLSELRAGIPPVRSVEQEMTELIAIYEHVRGARSHD